MTSDGTEIKRFMSKVTDQRELQRQIKAYQMAKKEAANDKVVNIEILAKRKELKEGLIKI